MSVKLAIALFGSTLLIFCHSSAQVYDFARGAHTQSLGNTSVVLQDAYSSGNNMAGMATGKKVTVAATFQNRYNLKELNATSFLVNFPIYRLKAGVNLMRFGHTVYNEQAISFGIAHKTGQVLLGLRVNYLQVKAGQYFNKSTFLAELGGIIHLTEQLHLGALVSNINRASFHSEYATYYLPVMLKSGIGYFPGKKVKIYLEAVKDLSKGLDWRGGVEYAPCYFLQLRSGLQHLSRIISFGAGIGNTRITLDYAISIYSGLGVVQQLSLQYNIKKS